MQQHHTKACIRAAMTTSKVSTPPCTIHAPPDDVTQAPERADSPSKRKPPSLNTPNTVPVRALAPEDLYTVYYNTVLGNL